MSGTGPRVAISVDMEGASGVADAPDVEPGAPGYPLGCELMLGDANAAVAGAFDAGAVEVVVNDAHDGMRNLDPRLLDTRALLVRGGTKRGWMVEGVAATTDVAFFVGYHARAGTPGAVLDHTMLSRELQGLFLNGDPAGELRLNAALAGSLGVPVALVTGDATLCREAEALLPGVTTVAVKEALGRYGARSLHPQVAQERIRAAATAALSRAVPDPYVIRPPVVLEADWQSVAIADACENVPGVQRVGARRVSFTSEDYGEVFRLFRVFVTLAAAVSGRPYTYD